MAFFKKSGDFARRAAGPRGARPGTRPSGRPSGRSYTGASAAPAERFQPPWPSCHTVCEVPFRPNGKKPVYCRDCFKGQEEALREPRTSAPHSADLSRQFELLNLKLDRLIKAVEGHSRQ